MSIPYLVLQQFVVTLEGVVHGFCYSRMLKPRWKNFPAWAAILVVWGVYILTLSMSWISGKRINSYVNLVVSFTLVQMVLWALYEERWKTRLWAWMLLYMMEVVADIAVSFIYVVVMKTPSVNYMEDEMLLVMCIVTLLGALLELAACSLYRKRRKLENREVGSFAIAAACLLVMLLYMLCIACGVYFGQGDYTGPFLVNAWISVGGTGLILLICWVEQKRQNRQERLEWENLQKIKNSQEAFFLGLERQERQAAFVRHDHMNILTLVSQLLQEDHEKEAEDILQDYLSRMETSAPVFCEEKTGMDHPERVKNR